MDIKLNLTSRGLEVHVRGEFDPRFEERGRITCSLLMEKLREEEISAGRCLKNTVVNFSNKSGTWVFEPGDKTVEQAKRSSLPFKDSRITKRKSPEKNTNPAPKPAASIATPLSVQPKNKSLQESKTPVSSKRKKNRRKTSGA